MALAPLLLVLGACGDSDDVSSSDTAASTTTDIPRLTFDGSTCVYESPVEVTAGVVVVEFVNDSDGTNNVFVGLLDEGKAVQDLIDENAAKGEYDHSQSEWLSDMGGQTPAGAGETTRWESSLAAGEYFVTCGDGSGLGLDFAAGTGLTVVND